MLHHLTLSHNHIQAHTLSQLELQVHPHPTARILFFSIPFLIVIICNIALYARIRRIHQNNYVYTLHSSFISTTVFWILVIGMAAVGVYAVIADSWTLKEWILFAIINGLLGAKALIYAADTKPTLFITTVLVIFSALFNQWLFSELRNVSELTAEDQFCKHITRNYIGFLEGALVIYSVELISETMVGMFDVFTKAGSLFFWIVAPLAIAGLLLLNILNFGPFVDSIGCIASSSLLFLGAASNTMFHNQKDDAIPLKR